MKAPTPSQMKLADDRQQVLFERPHSEARGRIASRSEDRIQNERSQTMKTRLNNLLVAGIFLAATSSALATMRYVNINSVSPTPPYANWATAARNIQDAVDAAAAGDEIVVTNGVYVGGGRVAVGPTRVGQPLTLRSVNGPEVTVINGGGTAQCPYLT